MTLIRNNNSRLLTERERKEGQRTALRFNLFGQLIQFIVLGQFLQLFASDVLGMKPTRIAAILSIIPLMLFLRVFMIERVRKIGRVKLLVWANIVRLLVMLVIFFLPVSLMSFGVLVTVLVIFSLAQQLGMGTVWQPLLRDITTVKDRGQFFSRMRMAFTLVNTGVLLLISVFVGERVTAFSYKALLLLAILGVINSIFWASRIPDVDSKNRNPSAMKRKRLGFLRFIKTCRESPLLRKPLLIIAMFQVAVMPMMVVYFREVLHLPAHLISIYLLMITLGAAVSFLIWGKIADSIGFQPMLKGLLVLNIVISPLFLLIAPFNQEVGVMVGSIDISHAITWVILIFLGLTGGALASGAGIAMTTIQHYHVRAKDSLESMNLFDIAIGLVTAGSMFFSGYLIEEIALPAGVVSFLGGFVHLDWVKVFLVAVIPAIQVCIFLMVRKLPNTRPAYAMDDFFGTLLNSPIRTLMAQRNTFHTDERVRVDLARWLGHSENPLAIDSLIELTRDPSYDVKVEAVRSLGLSHSSEAGEVLLNIIKDEKKQHLVDHVAWALGELRYVEAIPQLVERLSPEFPFRIRAMAARALGRIGDPSTIEPIADTLRNPDIIPHIRSSCVKALISLDSKNQAKLIFVSFDLLDNRYESVELMAAFCEWMGASSEWLLRRKTEQSMRKGFISYMDESSRSNRKKKADLIKIIEKSDIKGLVALITEREVPKNERVAILYPVLREHVQHSSEWLPSALLVSIILASED
ncbi:MAG: MFS transporter [Opitutaceae bacterium]|nr:MFS transporter [Opitutaceae bacterium]